MVRQQVSLNDLALLLPRQGVEYFSQFAPCLAKQHLAPSLGHKHHMIYSPNERKLFRATSPLWEVSPDR